MKKETKEKLIAAIRQTKEFIDTEQPNKIISHHGICYKERFDNVTLEFTPKACSGCPIFIFVSHRDEKYSKNDIKEFRSAVFKTCKIKNSWNGEACFSFSVMIDYTGPAKTMVDNYNNWLETHGLDKNWPKKLNPKLPEGWV